MKNKSLIAFTLAAMVAAFHTTCANAGPFDALAPAASASGASDAAQAVEVIAKGYGADAQGSLKAALRAAVEKVVGQLVDATTLVENDELVEDKILTYANAFVKTYETIGEPKAGADGLVATTVKAIVEKGQIAKKVREITKTETAVSGNGLFAELATRQTSIADAKAMLDELFKDVPLKLLKADTVKKADGTPSFQLDAETGELLIDVELGVDPEKYAVWTADLMQKFGKMAAKTFDFGIKSFDKRYSDPLGLSLKYEDGNNGVYTTECQEGDNEEKQFYAYVRIAIPVSPALYDFSASKNRFKIYGYGFDKDMSASLGIGSTHESQRIGGVSFAPAASLFSAKVILRDAAGNDVAEGRDSFRLYGDSAYHDSTVARRDASQHFICQTEQFGEMWVLPGWFHGHDYFCAKLRLRVNMGKFDPEELQVVEKIVCEPICKTN